MWSKKWRNGCDKRICLIGFVCLIDETFGKSKGVFVDRDIKGRGESVER
jgi:hypothetical protein